MRPEEEINEMIRKLEVKASAQLDERVHSEISRALEKPGKMEPAASQPNVWRIIMKSRIAKLAAAACVAVVVGVVLFWSGTGVTSKAYAMSNVPGLFLTAKTIHMGGRMYFPSTVPNGRRTWVEVEYWLDMGNTRWRLSRPGYVSDSNGMQIQIKECISDGEYEMLVDHTARSVSFSRLSPFQGRLFVRSNVYSLLQYLCGDPRLLDDYKKVGEETIDGEVFNIWEAVKGADPGPSVKLRVWLSPATGEFGKAIFWLRGQSGDWDKQMEINFVARNVKIKDEVFTTAAPAGYTLKNTKETATVQELNQGSVGYDSVTVQCHILFAMTDGTVIVGWSCISRESDASQAELFRDLNFGGELPKVAVKIAALSPVANDKKVIDEGTVCRGYHLAHTQKAGRFYEWGVYPSVKEVNPAQVWGYRLQLRSHFPDQNKNKDIEKCSLTMPASLVIQDARDFEMFVRGAMAECSDDGVLPDEVTYENVRELSKRMRTTTGDQ